MTAIKDEEIREMGEAMYPIINTGTKTFRQFAEAVARFARLAKAEQKEISLFEERIEIR